MTGTATGPSVLYIEEMQTHLVADRNPGDAIEYEKVWRRPSGQQIVPLVTAPPAVTGVALPDQT